MIFLGFRTQWVKHDPKTNFAVRPLVYHQAVSHELWWDRQLNFQTWCISVATRTTNTKKTAENKYLKKLPYDKRVFLSFYSILITTASRCLSCIDKGMELFLLESDTHLPIFFCMLVIWAVQMGYGLFFYNRRVLVT